MRGFLVIIFPLIFFTVLSCKKSEPSINLREIEVNAPFEMSAITVPDFANCSEYIITDFGAVQNDQKLTSKAITKAMELANQSGGGVVIIPKGEWLTSKIHFRSNVNLHLEKGAILLFSDNPKDYLPEVHTTWEGMECYNYSPLIYAYECTNVAITGEGTVKAKMDLWEKWFPRPPAHMNSLKHLYTMASTGVPVEDRVMVNDTANLRPHFIQFNRCKNVLIEGISVRNSPFWTIHPYLCKDVVIRNLDVHAHGHNNDGVDPEMSQNILIENCIFDQGDDAIAVKSGRNQDAWRLNTPTKNLVIRNCTVKNGHQLLAIGSELSGGVENVFMDSCIVANDANMFNLVFIKTNERRGGYVKNIYVSNIKANKMRDGILGIETDVLYQWRNLVPTYEKRLTHISDLYLSNIQADTVKFISRILGQAELPVKKIRLEKVQANEVIDQDYIHENLLDFQVR